MNEIFIALIAFTLIIIGYITFVMALILKKIK